MFNKLLDFLRGNAQDRLRGTPRLDLSPPNTRRKRVVLRVEEFEPKITPATFRWNVAGGGGAWNGQGNWANAAGNQVMAVPGQGDDVQILATTASGAAAGLCGITAG